ncbi:MAG: epimerase, partial [Chloroflexota bacterium]|nr:epimerase [Chloroflexota bacterium]
AESGSDARFTYVEEQFLLEAGVGPWIELPLWIPDAPGAATVNCGKAIAAGLTFRPIAETVRDTLAWDATRPPDVERRAGLKREREAELLQAWHSSMATGS